MSDELIAELKSYRQRRLEEALKDARNEILLWVRVQEVPRGGEAAEDPGPRLEAYDGIAAAAERSIARLRQGPARAFEHQGNGGHLRPSGAGREQAGDEKAPGINPRIQTAESQKAV
jgi:hypothetical protein